MIKPCGGIIEPCSPRGPRYSGKLIARAIELYLNGVKPGYIRWDELQATLEREFPSECPEVAEDKPSPETVLSWVRRWPDAPQRLKDLRVQQAGLDNWQPCLTGNTCTYQLISPVPMPSIRSTNTWLSALFQQFVVVIVFALMAHFAMALCRD